MFKLYLIVKLFGLVWGIPLTGPITMEQCHASDGTFGVVHCVEVTNAD